MSPITRHHAMPADLFAELATGGGSQEAIRRLVSAQRSKHVILLHGVVQRARDEQDRIALAGWDLLAEVQRRDRAAAQAVISYPSVGAWAMHTLRGDQHIPGAQPASLAAVAAAAAVRAGLDAEIEVAVTGGKVVLPSLGLIQVADAESVTIRTAGISPGADGWQDLRQASSGDLDVIIDDLDPFRMPADDGAPAGRLTAAELDGFRTVLRDAWTVLPRSSAEQIAAVVRVVVPYQAPEGGLVSTSSPESFGTVAMSRQPDKYTCAETLVHETQHLKLCALLDLVPMTRRPDDGQRYYAPWRTDPRPASGLLQGAYAFLGVSGFWRGQRHTAPEAEIRSRAEADFVRWRDGAAQVARSLLDSGQLTEEGETFVATMAQVLAAW